MTPNFQVPCDDPTWPSASAAALTSRGMLAIAISAYAMRSIKLALCELEIINPSVLVKKRMREKAHKNGHFLYVGILYQPCEVGLISHPAV